MTSWSQKNGFTFVEMIVALFILSIGLLGICTLFVKTLSTDGTSKVDTAAATLADQEIEQLKSIGYAGVTSGSDSPAVGNQTYARSWTVTTASGTLKKVTVTVTSGSEQTVLSTYMAQQ